MNKFVLLLILSACGFSGGLFRGPYIPLVIYYLFAVLRPQFIWRWQLIAFPDLGWSFYAAAAALLSYLPWALGIIGPANDPERRVGVPFTFVHKFMLGFVVWNALSYGNSNNQGVSYPVFEDLLKIFAMFFVSAQVVRAIWQVRIIYLMCTLSIGYIAVEINQIYVETGYLVLLKQGFAGLDNNGAALLLAMAIPLCYFAWEMTSGWYRWGYLLFIPLILHAVVSSYSRGAMLSCVGPMLLALLYTRKRWFLAGCYVVILCMLPFLAGEEIRERFLTSTNAGEDETFQQRQASWAAAISIANEYPVFGAGIRCSNLLSHQYGADMEGRTIHNNFLQIAADCGWFGLGWYLLVVGGTLVALWRARIRIWRRRDPESMRLFAMIGGLECCLLTFLIGSFALSMETFEPLYLILMMSVQVWAIMNAKIQPPPGVQLVPTPPNQVRIGVPQPAWTPRQSIDSEMSGPIYTAGPGTLPERTRPSDS